MGEGTGNTMAELKESGGEQESTIQTVEQSRMQEHGKAEVDKVVKFVRKRN